MMLSGSFWMDGSSSVSRTAGKKVVSSPRLSSQSQLVNIIYVKAVAKPASQEFYKHLITYSELWRREIIKNNNNNNHHFIQK